MESRRRYLVSQVLLFLLIVAAGLAVSRLTIEGLWAGSLFLIEKGVKHPLLSTLVLSSLCFLSFLRFFDLKMAHRRGIRLLTDLLVLLVSITVGVLSFQLFAGGYLIGFVAPRAYDWNRLLEPFLKQPLLCSLNLLLFCVICFSVIKMEYRRVIHIAARVVVLLIIGTAWSFAAQLLGSGVLGFISEGFGASVYLVSGLFLIFCCAAVLKYVFSLEARHWTLFFANLTTVFGMIFCSFLRD
jgi:hypothetical protein